MVSCPMMPLGPASVGSGEGSVFFTAARVAEAAGRAQAEGKKRRCSRNSRDVITPEECLERFRTGLRPCVTPFSEMGRCHTGVLEDAKHPEDTMARGICRNPECPNAGERIRYAARGFCSKCYPKVLKGLIPDPDKREISAPVDPLEMREFPDPGHDEMPATAAIQGDGVDVSGRAEPFGEIEALPPKQPQASPILAREEVAALDEASGQDHVEGDLTMVPELPEDLTAPFILAGIEFAPLHKRRQSGENYVALRTTSLGISTAAEAELGLKRYTHARYTVSLDGTAVAIKFLTEKKPGALCVNRSTGSMAISAQPLASKHPELIGKKARLEATDVRDWFVARFGGEAA